MDVSVTLLTVRIVEPVVPLRFADMVDAPAVRPIAVPSEATVATDVVDEVHETCVEISCVVLSE